MPKLQMTAGVLEAAYSEGPGHHWANTDPMKFSKEKHEVLC